MEGITVQLDVLENVIACDETWIFRYDPEPEMQSTHWKTPTSLRIKNKQE
jgi:hypothetical protein